MLQYLKVQIGLGLILLLLSACGNKTTNKMVDGWQILFDGSDLEGWKRLNGSAEFSIEDNAIVGTTERGQPNTFLVTEAHFSDFILELEFMGDPFINSGIQIRSNSTDYQGGKVHGYQVDLDPSERAWSGGIYDESRRGWLYPMGLNPAGGKAFKSDAWNKIYIEAIGNEIKTWINDVPAAYLIDDMTPSGFIALQIHSVDRPELNGRKMKWRNIRIKTTGLEPKEGAFPYVVNLIPNQLDEAEVALGWISLFDGQNTTAWRGAHSEDFPDKGWTVANGLLTTSATESAEERGGDIVTRDAFGACEFQTEFRLTKAANSGIKYLVTEEYGDTPGSAIGPEYQIIDEAGYEDSHEPLPENRGLGSLYDMISPEFPERFLRPVGEWNHLRIVIAPNGKVEHWLNYIKILEYTRGSAAFNQLVNDSKYKEYRNFGMADQGHILLQDHGGAVSFRSIKLRNL